MKRLVHRADIKRDIPLFDDSTETDDEIFSSIVWDLCGRRPRASQPNY
jgi:hypothetical protein